MFKNKRAFSKTGNVRETTREKIGWLLVGAAISSNKVCPIFLTARVLLRESGFDEGTARTICYNVSASVDGTSKLRPKDTKRPPSPRTR